MDWEVRGLRCMDYEDQLRERLALFPETWASNTTIEAIVESLRRGRDQLWGVFDPQDRLRLLVLTRVEGPEDQRVFLVWWASGPGGLEAILQLGFLEDVAKSLGCKELQVAGRKGWGKVLLDQGYTFRYQVVGKVLEA